MYMMSTSIMCSNKQNKLGNDSIYWVIYYLDDSLNNTFCHTLHIDLITIAYMYNSLEQCSYCCIYEGDIFT